MTLVIIVFNILKLTHYSRRSIYVQVIVACKSRSRIAFCAIP